MGWDAGSIESRLDVDLSPFHHGLQKAKDEAREFADKRYTATVDINTKRSQDELSAVETRLHSIESSLDRIGTKTGGAGGGGRGFGGGSSGGRGGFLSRLPNPSWMSLGIGAAIPAAVPFAGLAGGIAGGALSAGVTGGLGLGAFGLAAKSNVTTITGDITKLNKLTGQYNAATTDKQRAAVLVKEQALWKSLDPQQRAAVKNVQALDAAWGRYKKKLEPQTFAVVADGAKIANTGLKYLLPTAQAVGDEVDLLAKRAERAFKAPFWHQFFGDFLPGEAARSVGTLGTVLGNVGTGVGHLVQDFAPLAHILEGGSESLSARFEKWTEGSGPGKFVAWVEKEGPPAAKALEGIGKGMIGLGKGLAPLGSLELKALTPILNFIGDLGDEHPAVITAVAGALLGVGGALKVIAGVRGIQGILGGIGGLGVRGGRGGFGGEISKAAPIPVYVTNWAGGGVPGGGGIPGEGAPGVPGVPGKSTRPSRIGRIVRTLPVIATVAALADAAHHVTTGENDASQRRLLKAAQTPAGVAALQQQYIAGQAALPHLSGPTAQVTRDLLKQIDTALKSVGASIGVTDSGFKHLGGTVKTSANDIDNAKSSLAGYRAEIATLGPQVMASLNSLTRMPNFLRDAEQAALNGGFLVGRNLKKGIIVGFQSTHGTVAMTNISQTVNGRTHISTVNAKLAAGGPMDPGNAYLVGERGPEIVTPRNAGQVHPNSQLQSLLRSGTTRLSPHDMSQLAREIGREIARNLPGVNQAAVDRSLGIAVMSA